MIETPPSVKEPTVYSGPSATGGGAMNIPTSAGSSRKSTGGTGGRARTKGSVACLLACFIFLPYSNAWKAPLSRRKPMSKLV